MVLDLSGTLLMDSGFSGTLSRLVGSGTTSFALYRAPRRILDGLEDHGVLEQVSLLDSESLPSLPQATTKVPLEPASKPEILRCCLDAHRALMALKPENVAKFEAVERFLSREAQRVESAPVPPHSDQG
jgi:hypothetical protein